MNKHATTSRNSEKLDGHFIIWNVKLFMLVLFALFAPYYINWYISDQKADVKTAEFQAECDAAEGVLIFGPSWKPRMKGRFYCVAKATDTVVFAKDF